MLEYDEFIFGLSLHKLKYYVSSQCDDKSL